MKSDVMTGEHFMHGNTASAEGAIAAGCRFFGGYPITPSTEIAEQMARRMPKIGGMFMQMEDELASIASVLGASNAGVKAMTATSGPGFSLMMENVGLGMITETPCVIVNVQRGGPSTGLPTMVAQSDIMQARWGSHGDYSTIAYAPWSPQEMFDYTVKSFNMSEKYRMPVFLMSDEILAHMTERVIIPPADQIEVINRKKPKVSPEEYQPYLADKDDLVPPMANAGDGYHIHMTGLVHDERGYPVLTAEVHNNLVKRLIDKVEKNKDKIIEVKEYHMEDAEIAVFAYGSLARTVLASVREARKKGKKVGLVRPLTLWPFPDRYIRDLAKRVKTIMVTEMNAGQLVGEVERYACADAKVLSFPKYGAHLVWPAEILDDIMGVQ